MYSVVLFFKKKLHYEPVFCEQIEFHWSAYRLIVFNLVIPFSKLSFMELSRPLFTYLSRRLKGKVASAKLRD